MIPPPLFLLVFIAIAIGMYGLYRTINKKTKNSNSDSKSNTNNLLKSSLPDRYQQCYPPPPGQDNQMYITHCMHNNIATYMDSLPNGTSDICTSDCMNNKIPGIVGAPGSICRSLCNHG
jgi:hypothetical protein